MPDRDHDPAANTQMFRAFVERGEPAPPRSRTLLRVTALVGALVVVAVVVWLLAH